MVGLPEGTSIYKGFPSEKKTTSVEVRGVPRSLAGAAQQSFVEAFSSSYQALLADALKDLEPAARRKSCGDADGMGWWGGPLDPNVWGNLGVHGDFMWYLPPGKLT